MNFTEILNSPAFKIKLLSIEKDFSCDSDKLELPPEFFCQTSFWQNDLVILVDIES